VSGLLGDLARICLETLQGGGWTSVEHESPSSIGQGRGPRETALQMARLYAAIANGAAGHAHLVEGPKLSRETWGSSLHLEGAATEAWRQVVTSGTCHPTPAETSPACRRWQAKPAPPKTHTRKRNTPGFRSLCAADSPTGDTIASGKQGATGATVAAPMVPKA